MPTCLTALLSWSGRRWLVALGVAVGTYLLIGLPTDVVPNPVFGRDVAVTSWSQPVLVATAVLCGILAATYVNGLPDESGKRVGGIGGLLSYFAIGCPVCNKLALLALGYSGAIKWFAPVQPYLAVIGLGLLFYVVRRRLTAESLCVL